MNLKAYFKKIGIPGAISAGSLLAAWLAIVLLLDGHLKYSIILAVVAFFLDSLDGYVARKINKTSELGRQLDSMVDLIGYSLYAALLTKQEVLPGWEGVLVGYVIILFGVLRLIRFNLEGYAQAGLVRYYRGIVTCHLSLAAVSLVLASTQLKIPTVCMVIFLLSLAVLQLSDIKTRKTGRLWFWYVVATLLVVGAIIWLP